MKTQMSIATMRQHSLKTECVPGSILTLGAKSGSREWFYNHDPEKRAKGWGG